MAGIINQFELLNGNYSKFIFIGEFIRPLDHKINSRLDYYLNNTDDADMGIYEHLKNRRFYREHEHINMIESSYVRFFRGGDRKIIFYSTDFDNNFGELYVFSY
ncbi:hypothetical protein F1B92_00810 [Campylobacter sp. FMV-PI01]|uniref:Uncharacterized protein n=1 Tax=Campylobacter portucalensis TaxID=2608384 RepID=A0A6L5WHP6_9BACT|nr:hypothetical protein [Campylobacter portucalensis]MSN95747.1 hypothetical protein [Campylobacter portucalensis]